MQRNYRYKLSSDGLDVVADVDGNSDMPIKKFSNVSILDTVSITGNSLALDGKYFLFPDDEHFYFHILRDYIAQFELVKRYVPDIKPIVLCACGKNDEVDKPTSCLGSNPKTNPELFILDTYGSELTIVDCTDLDAVVLESVYFIYVNGPEQLTDFIDVYNYDNVVLKSNNNYWLEDMFAKTLRESFSPHLKETDLNKKIYVSRLRESEKTWEISDAWDSYVLTGNLPVDEKMAITIKNIAKALPEALDELELKKSRAYSIEDEHYLQDYFKSRGYEIVSPGDYSVLEQISMFSSSSIVVGAGGSGMTNMLFCNPQSKIILLAAGNRFNFGGHTPLARALGKRCSFFPERVTVDHDNPDYVKFSAKEIIDMIESSGVKL